MIKTIAAAAVAALLAAAPALAGPGLILQGPSLNGFVPLPVPFPVDGSMNGDFENPAHVTAAGTTATHGPLSLAPTGGGVWLNGTSSNGLDDVALHTARAPLSLAPTGGGVWLNGTSTNGLALNGLQWNGARLNGKNFNGKLFNSKFLNGAGTGAANPERQTATFAVTAITLLGGARMTIAR